MSEKSGHVRLNGNPNPTQEYQHNTMQQQMALPSFVT